MILTDERPIVVGIGEAVLDCYQDGTNRKELGGAPLIFAYHAAKSHCRGVIISAIKNDADGYRIKTQVEKKGVIGIFNTVDNKPSGTVAVNNEKPDDPKYNIDINAAWSEITYPQKLEDIKGLEEFEELEDLAKKIKAVYFGTLASFCGEHPTGTSKQAIETFLSLVPEECWKIFDMNLRRNPNEEGIYNHNLFEERLINEYIRECNILKANEEELKYLCEINDIKKKTKGSDTIGKKLMDHFSNIKILILTKGKKGSTVFWRNEKDKKDDKDNNMIFSQSIHISVKRKHTVGAGDAMVGAFIGELLNGRSESEAHLIAARRSVMVCKEDNSMPEISGKDFFFSYSKNDIEVVDLFYNKFIYSNEYTVFKDLPNIKPGSNLGNVIADAIDNCQVFVYFSSENASKSQNVKWEIDKATNAKKTIIIIKLDNSEYPEGLQKYLEPIRYLSFEWYLQTKYLKLDVDRNLNDDYNEIIDFYKNRPI